MAADSVEHYEREADVLVVGFGCAGAAAAHEAASTGAEVLVLERASGPGGSSALSGGEIYLGGGTSVQRACGFEDTAEDMFAFLAAALGPHADEEKLRLYCEGSTEHFQWLCDRGVTFQERLFEHPTWAPPTTDGLMWMGENSWPYNTIARPAPRGHRPAAEHFGGWLLMDVLAAAAREAGAEPVVDTAVSALIVDGADRVVGVRARQYGAELDFRARKAVVLTTGGFVDDEQMLDQHAAHLLGHGKVSDGLDDGSGIRMAAALGAATRRMSVVQIALQVVPMVIARGMLVNARGQRFLNEDVYPGLISAAAVQHQPGPCWSIIDETGFESIAERELWGVRPTFVAETLAELEELTGMPPGSLETTVEVYNRHAEEGEDPHFHKGADWLRPLRAPFAAIAPGFPTESGSAPGTGIAGFTLGGLHTTPDGAVLDHCGEAVPGLFAAGRASSGLHGEGYISGTSLGDGTFFGRRAGRVAAREVG